MVASNADAAQKWTSQPSGPTQRVCHSLIGQLKRAVSWIHEQHSDTDWLKAGWPGVFLLELANLSLLCKILRIKTEQTRYSCSGPKRQSRPRAKEL